jgi:hypothetical protein
VILPSKHLPVERSLIGVSAIILRSLTKPATVSELWESASEGGIATFDQFVLGLDLLYALGAVDRFDGRVLRT